MSGSEEIIRKTEMIKPKAFYHASINKNITVLEPRAEKVRDKSEGPVVFASPDKASVTRFIVRTDDSWTKKGTFNGVHFIIISDKNRFHQLDQGGAIYQLEPDSFYQNKTIKGMRHEWVSKEPVMPVAKEVFESGLQAMLDNGVQVFFVDQETFKQIARSNDYGNEIMRKLESENKRLKINFREIPPLNAR